MSADPLTAFRLLAVDVNSLASMRDRLSAGNVSESEQLRMSRELRRIVDAAKDNPYREDPKRPPTFP